MQPALWQYYSDHAQHEIHQNEFLFSHLNARIFEGFRFKQVYEAVDVFGIMWLIKPLRASSHETLSWARFGTLTGADSGLTGNRGHDITRQSLTVIGFEKHVDSRENRNHRVLNLFFFSSALFENPKVALYLCLIVAHLIIPTLSKHVALRALFRRHGTDPRQTAGLQSCLLWDVLS